VSEPWNPHWKTLLDHLKKAVPTDWMVIVLSDRGLESPELFAAIASQGWHPLMRVKKAGKFRPTGWTKFYEFHELVCEVGTSFYAEGHAYSSKEMACTLLARYEEGYEEPWLLLSDLPPEAGNAVWYAFRGWIEQGFKIIKSGGWGWQNTRMEDPDRVERLWLVMAVATLWLVAVGVEDEVQEQTEAERTKQQRAFAESQEQAKARLEQERRRQEKIKESVRKRKERKENREREKQEKRQAKRRQRQAKKQEQLAKNQETQAPEQQATGQKTSSNPADEPKQTIAVKKTVPSRVRRKKEIGKERLHRVFTRGWAELQARWSRGDNCLPQHLHPETWPQPCQPRSKLTEQEFLSRKTYP
jgi:hypothetical protein